jgi:hypothetical protein
MKTFQIAAALYEIYTTCRQFSLVGMTQPHIARHFPERLHQLHRTVEAQRTCDCHTDSKPCHVHQSTFQPTYHPLVSTLQLSKICYIYIHFC